MLRPRRSLPRPPSAPAQPSSAARPAPGQRPSPLFCQPPLAAGLPRVHVPSPPLAAGPGAPRLAPAPSSASRLWPQAYREFMFPPASSCSQPAFGRRPAPATGLDSRSASSLLRALTWEAEVPELGARRYAPRALSLSPPRPPRAALVLSLLPALASSVLGPCGCQELSSLTHVPTASSLP
jgi:hypothetical protein